MNQKIIPTLIGLFVVGAAVLSVAGAIYFGGGQAFEQKNTYVMYFEGSMKGLDVGAPLMYRGVRVGYVTKVVLRYYTDENRTEIPVFVDILHSSIEQHGAPQKVGKDLPILIERGLRAELAMSSFVTGKLGIQLAYHPDKPAQYRDRDELDPVTGDVIMEIPTIQSGIEELKQTIEDLPIQEIAEDLRHAIQGFDELVRSEKLAAAIESFDTTVKDVGELARNIDAEVDPLVTSVKDTFDGANELIRSPRVTDTIDSIDVTVDDFGVLARNVNEEVKPLSGNVQSTLGKADTTLDTITGVMRKDSPMHYEIIRALREVSEAAKAISELADMLERRPEMLIQGKN